MLRGELIDGKAGMARTAWSFDFLMRSLSHTHSHTLYFSFFLFCRCALKRSNVVLPIWHDRDEAKIGLSMIGGMEASLGRAMEGGFGRCREVSSPESSGEDSETYLRGG